MKVIICGSMAMSKSMIIAEEELLKRGHTVVLPRFTKDYAQMETLDHIHAESAKNKIEHDLIRDYYNEIALGDAVLIINEDKNGIKNYVGGNSFLEMGFGHVLNKKVYLLNPIPQMPYTDEIIAMQPIILDNNFDKLV